MRTQAKLHTDARYPGFTELRTIPGKPEIAFVEYLDIPSSVTARESLHGYTFPEGERLKVTFARA